MHSANNDTNRGRRADRRTTRGSSCSPASPPLPRAARGSSFIEIAASVFLVVIVAALGVDVVLLIFGASVNDSACRDAARAAAQASDYGKSLSLAKASVNNHRTDGYMISQPVITNFDYHDYLPGTPPPNETPYVLVATRVTVRLPAPLFFFGAQFTNGTMQFIQSYAYPIIKTKILLP